MTCKIIVTGSRDWDDEDAVRRALQGAWVKFGSDVILISGNCPRGADYIAERYAAESGWTIEKYPANWQLYGKRAGYIRNADMINANLDADVCFGFLKNGSKGTTHTLELARKADIPTNVQIGR